MQLKKILLACFVATAAFGETKVRNAQVSSATVQVTDKGALCNDSQDDTTKIQSAIDSLPVGVVTTTGNGVVYAGEAVVLGGGGVVVFPQGKTCKITGSVAVPANVTLDLNQSTLKLYGASATAIVRKHNAGVYADNNIGVRNGTIMSGDSTAGQNGIVLDTVDHPDVENVYLHNLAGIGLSLKKAQWGYFQNVRASNCGAGLRLDVNTDGFGSHDNLFGKYWAEGDGTGAYVTGWNNYFAAATVQNSTSVGVQVTTAGSEGAFNNVFVGLHLEFHNTVFDFLNQGTGTTIRDCVMVVPPTPANKTKRFIRNEADLRVENCATQGSNLSISSSPALIEHFSGTTRVYGGTYGVLLNAEQIVVDETGVNTSSKIRDNVFVSKWSPSYSGESTLGLLQVMRASTTDAIMVRNIGDTNQRGSWWSDGSIHLGGGAAPVDTTIDRRSNGVGLTGLVCTGGTLYCGAQALTTGSATVTVQSGCRPICTDTTANVSVKCSVASTTLTITGTGTDTINYLCF